MNWKPIGNNGGARVSAVETVRNYPPLTGALAPGAPIFPCAGTAAGRRFGPEELEALRRVVESGALNRNAGETVKKFERAFATYYGRKHCVMVSSGTAAIHVALGSLGINPGDEVITSPITDMGTVAPILLSNAIPVFADLDERTFLMDPASIEANITKRTRAIMPVHLAGYPCDMGAIKAIATRHGIPIVEDCCQAYCCGYQGRWVGQLTEIGCFSLNQHKHITCGDGGMMVTDDDALAVRAKLFADKGWAREQSIRDYLFLAPNYRVTELQAAVALAQLQKLASVVRDRRRIAERILAGVDSCGVFEWMQPVQGAEPSYWFLLARARKRPRDELGKFLIQRGVPAMNGYLSAPIYRSTMLAHMKTFGDSGWPHRAAEIQSSRTYEWGLCPRAEHLVAETFVVQINENYGDEQVAYVLAALKDMAARLA